MSSLSPPNIARIAPIRISPPGTPIASSSLVVNSEDLGAGTSDGALVVRLPLVAGTVVPKSPSRADDALVSIDAFVVEVTSDSALLRAKPIAVSG